MFIFLYSFYFSHSHLSASDNPQSNKFFLVRPHFALIWLIVLLNAQRESFPVCNSSFGSITTESFSLLTLMFRFYRFALSRSTSPSIAQLVLRKPFLDFERNFAGVMLCVHWVSVVNLYFCPSDVCRDIASYLYWCYTSERK